MRPSSTSWAWLGAIMVCLGGCAAGPATEAASARPAPASEDVAAAAPPVAPVPTAARVTFPELVTRDLNGATQRLPHGLPGELKLFLIAYQREQQADLDPWLTLALPLERAHPGFRVYELPTLSAAWGAAASFIDGGMRRGIPDPQARARTLTLYLDKDSFNQALALPSEDQVYALLVDGTGLVVWRGAGALDDAAGAALTAAVRSRLGG
ncbi:MAG: hypothetical protein IPL61_04490 [Myxococcales bacterium]|nr:hypothetical protein [Myxococcales bacterium]